MKLNRIALISLIAGVLLAVIGVTIPLFIMNGMGADSAIIGGADMPTYCFIFSNYTAGLPVYLVLFGISVAIASLFYLVLPQTVKTISGKKMCVILGLSISVAMVLVCVIKWFSIILFNEMDQYPFAYPLSKVVGLLSLVAFVALLIRYIILRKKSWSTVGFIIDVVQSLLSFPAFFFLFSYLSSLI